MDKTTSTPPPETDDRAVQDLLREFRHLLDERMKVEAGRNRRGRVLGWIALVLAVVALAATAGILYYAFYRDLPLLTSPSVQAREVVLVDGSGTRRVLWTVDADGAARLSLLDGQGVPRLKLTLKANGEQGVSLADETGANRVVLGYLADESSTLAFADAAGTTRVVLGTSAAEAGSLLFADRNGGARAALGLSPTGEPTFWWPELEEPAAAGDPGN